MNSGTACKNLTDGLVIAMVIFALIGLLMGYLLFEEKYVVKDPETNEDITVEKPLDDPYVKIYLKMFAVFTLSVTVSMAAKKFPLISIICSVIMIVFAMNCFAKELMKENSFSYVLVAVTSLAGNCVYTYFYYKERDREQIKKKKLSRAKKEKIEKK